MRNAVTFAAIRETFMHCLGMRQAMALVAFGNRHVLFRMTGRTGNFAVLGLARDQRGQSRIVTRSAQFRRRAVRVGNGQRHMRLVTGRAVGLGHRLGVSFVAHHALGDVAVGIGMTEITGKRFMHARVGNHLLLRSSMATHANGLLLTLDGDVQRFMRVMAAEAVIDFVVGAALVALAALRDVVGDGRPVAGMTGCAVDFRFVGRTICFDLRGLLAVTLDAVVGSQHCLSSQSGVIQARYERNCKNCDQQVFHLRLGQHTTSFA